MAMKRTGKACLVHSSLRLILAAAAIMVSAGLVQQTHAACVNPGGTGGCAGTIQAAIDAASPGDTINVYPGTYNLDEANNRDPLTGGAGSNDFNIFVNKALTIRGVTAGGAPITDYNNVAAFVIAKRNLPTFGADAIFVQADNVTITGLDITGYEDLVNYNNKTVEVTGDNFTLKYSKVHALDQTASVYIDDTHYNSGTDTSHVQSYRIEANLIDGGGNLSDGFWAVGIYISSGPGWSGAVSGRVITGNTISNCVDGISFVGPGANPWDYYPVGAATITGNTFASNDRRHVIAWGKYKGVQGYTNLDWPGIVTSNTFDKAAVTWTPGGDARSWDSAGLGFYYIRGIYSAIQRYAVNKAVAGDTVQVLAGTYEEQVEISKPLTLSGTGGPIIQSPASLALSFTTSEVNKPVVYVHGTDNVTIKGLTVDGAGLGNANYRFVGIAYYDAGGHVTNVEIKNIEDTPFSGAQHGNGIYAYSTAGTARSLQVDHVNVHNYQKTGMVFTGANLTVNAHDNTVTGIGHTSVTAQNGIQISNGAVGTISNNEVQGNYYTPMSWCAAGVLVISDGVNIVGNTMDGNLCDLDAATSGSTIDGNIVNPAGVWPFSVYGDNNTVSGNVVNGSPDSSGVYVDGTGNTFTCNRVTNNVGGFYFDNYSGAGTPNAVHNNLIAGNGVGVDASVVGAPPNIDATGNWWGCPDGPGGTGCDTITAKVDEPSPLSAPPECVSCTGAADGAPCNDGLFCNGTDTCSAETCSVHSGDPCAGGPECDNACNESAGNCHVTAGTACTDDGNVCTLDQCDGSGACQHPAGHAGTVCRPAASGGCDVAETCTGSSGSCPVDSFASASTHCTGVSQGGACDNDAADHCLGTANTCVDVFLPSSTVCRASAGQCDVAETCPGTSGACPADGFASSSAHCTGTSQGGLCDNDAADHCTGTSNACVDVFQSGTICRASAGQCDVAETCTGTSGACPADGFKSSSVHCTGTSQGGVCDNDAADHCTGTSPTACVDAFKSSSTVCLEASQCAVAEEKCTGSSGNCPLATTEPDGTPCNDGDTCQAGVCTGANSLTLGSVRLRLNTSKKGKNGFVRVNALVNDNDTGGALITNLPNGTTTLEVSDGREQQVPGTGFHTTITLTNCKVNSQKGSASCRDRSTKTTVTFRPQLFAIYHFIYKMNVARTGLGTTDTGSAQPSAPVEVILHQRPLTLEGGELVRRPNSTSACKSSGRNTLSCKEPRS